jgi:hypothetical protein
MTEEDKTAPAGNWRGFLAVVAAALALDVLALAKHPEFQPAYLLRTIAPAIALVLGAAFTHRVAKRRAEIDVPGEFNPGGRSLFLGFIMVAVTLLAWLLSAQAVPSLMNAALGLARSEVAVVTEKPAVTTDPDCGHRLVITSDSLARPLDECVAEPLWRGAAVGSKITVDLSASVFGAEALGLRP